MKREEIMARVELAYLSELRSFCGVCKSEGVDCVGVIESLMEYVIRLLDNDVIEERVGVIEFPSASMCLKMGVLEDFVYEGIRVNERVFSEYLILIDNKILSYEI